MGRNGLGSAMGKGLWTGAIVLLTLSACESKEDVSQGAPEGRGEAQEAPKVAAMAWEPGYQGAHAAAQDAVGVAIRDSVNRAWLALRPKLIAVTEEVERERPEGGGRSISLMFGANVHGELVECDCEVNALGGLARRQTLNRHDAKPPAASVWSAWAANQPKSAARFAVDAGDLLYGSTSLDRANPAAQRAARGAAKTVVEALSVAPPDAVNIGENDLAFGLEALQELAEAADFSFVSANLVTEAGDRPFPGYVVVERDGASIAVIGVLKEQPRIKGYYTRRSVRVESAVEAYLREVAELGEGVDVVVLLSNQGLRGTREMVGELRAKGARVDAAVVSNSNRRTTSPVWVDGVPLVEPASRGKYYGRLDLLLGDEPGVAFTNGLDSPVEAYRGYVSAWNMWANARSAQAQMRVELASLRLSGAAKESAGGVDEEGSVALSEEVVDSRIDYLGKRLGMLDKRAERTSEALASAHGKLKGLDHYKRPRAGDDWAGLTLVPVALDIPRDPAVAKVVDAAAAEPK